VNKHNARAQDARVLYLNYSAVDPALTNEKCSPWHFRFDAHADMRMHALTEVMRQDAALKKVYLLNQDYSFGRSVARSAREQLAAKRSDVMVAGDELHPLGRIKDFAPYISKIVAAGADAVITGNWGNDLALLVKAAKEAGFQGKFYTFYGNALGTPAAIGEAGVGKVMAVAEWHYNAGEPTAQRIYQDFRQRYPKPADDYLNARMVTMIDMLAAAIEKAGSVQAVAVAKALAGMQHNAAPHAVTMRAADHQLISPLYVFRMERAGGAVKQDVEGSGYGFVTQQRVDAAALTLPTRCQMAAIQ
jgi:branched-chain amino acid transport system substrate-binding protein